MANIVHRGLSTTSRRYFQRESCVSLPKCFPNRHPRWFSQNPFCTRQQSNTAYQTTYLRKSDFPVPFNCAKLCSSRAASTHARDKPTVQSRSLTSEPDRKPTLKSRLTSLTPYENIYTIPNILTFSRLAVTPVIGYLVLNDHYVAAVSLFAYAGFTDLIDGWIARRWNMQTVVGTVIDPMADKALMTVLTVCLAVKGFLPLYLTTLILGRDLSLAIAAIYYRFISLPPPRTLARYWDFSLPSAEVHPTTISKVNTALQLLLIGSTVALPVFGPSVGSLIAEIGNGIALEKVMTGFQWVVAGTTIWSGASYLYTTSAVKILTGTEQQKRQGLFKGRLVIAATFATCLATAFAVSQMEQEKQKEGDSDLE